MAKPTTQRKKAAPVAAEPKQRAVVGHEVVLSPSIQGAVGIHAWSKFAGEADLGGLIEGLRQQIKEIQGGDLRQVEAMLYGQALTLETIFTSLARKAEAQDYLKQFQVNLTLALKAQAQCRATLEALTEIKNPRQVAFVRQANIAHQQQVNNAVGAEAGPIRAGAHAHASKSAGEQNELLEASHGKPLDTRAQSQAGGNDPHLEAVATGHRATHG